MIVTEPGGQINTTANQSAYSFAPFTPAIGSTLVVMVLASGTAAATGTMSGGGLSWNQAQYSHYDVTSNARHAYLFWANAGGSPDSTAITFTANGTATGCAAVCLQVDGSHSVTPVRQSALAYGFTNPSVNFPSAVLPTSLVIAGFGIPRNPPVSSPPSGWTEVMDTGYDTPTNGASAAYKFGNVSLPIVFATGGGERVALAIEIIPAPGFGTACLDDEAHNYTVGTCDLFMAEIINESAGADVLVGNIVTSTFDDDTEDFDAFDPQGDEEHPISVMIRNGVRITFTTDEITCQNLTKMLNDDPVVAGLGDRWGLDAVTRRKMWRVTLEHTMSCGTLISIHLHRASIVNRGSWLLSPDTIHALTFELRAFPSHGEEHPFGYIEMTPAECAVS